MKKQLIAILLLIIFFIPIKTFAENEPYIDEENWYFNDDFSSEIYLDDTLYNNPIETSTPKNNKPKVDLRENELINVQQPQQNKTPTKIRRIKKDTDHFFDNHWGAILGLVIGFVCRSPLIVCLGVILGFIADYQRLEGARLIPFQNLSKYWQKINPLKLWRNAYGGEHRRYLEVMAALAASIAEADGKVTAKEKEVFNQVFAVKPKQKSLVADIFNTPTKHLRSVEQYALVLEELTRMNEDLKESSLESLFKIAAANVAVSEKQLEMLKQIVDIINLDPEAFVKIKSIFYKKPISKKLAKCYEILEVPQDASMAEIKAQWKKMIMIHHPDKLTNASKEQIKEATAKMADINRAYQEIVKAKTKI